MLCTCRADRVQRGARLGTQTRGIIITVSLTGDVDRAGGAAQFGYLTSCVSDTVPVSMLDSKRDSANSLTASVAKGVKYIAASSIMTDCISCASDLPVYKAQNWAKVERATYSCKYSTCTVEHVRKRQATRLLLSATLVSQACSGRESQISRLASGHILVLRVEVVGVLSGTNLFEYPLKPGLQDLIVDIDCCISRQPVDHLATHEDHEPKGGANCFDQF